MDESLRQALRTFPPLIWHNGDVGLDEVSSMNSAHPPKVVDNLEDFLKDTRGRLVILVLRDPTPEQEQEILHATKAIIRGHLSHVSDLFNPHQVRSVVILASQAPQVRELVDYIYPTGAPLDYGAPVVAAQPFESVLNLDEVAHLFPRVALNFTPKPTLHDGISAQLLASALSMKRHALRKETEPMITQEDYDQAVSNWAQIRTSHGLFSGVQAH